MKLQLIFLLMDILLFLACGFLWLKSTLQYAMNRFGITKP